MTRFKITLNPGTLSLGPNGMFDATWIPSTVSPIDFGYVEPASPRSPTNSQPITETWYFAKRLGQDPAHGTGPWRMDFTSTSENPTETARPTTITKVSQFGLVIRRLAAELKESGIDVSASTLEDDIRTMQIQAGDYIIMWRPSSNDVWSYVGRASMTTNGLKEYWITGPAGLPSITHGAQHVIAQMGHAQASLGQAQQFLEGLEFSPAADWKRFEIVHQ